jgi:hypothetical protein
VDAARSNRCEMQESQIEANRRDSSAPSFVQRVGNEARARLWTDGKRRRSRLAPQDSRSHEKPQRKEDARCGSDLTHT